MMLHGSESSVSAASSAIMLWTKPVARIPRSKKKTTVSRSILRRKSTSREIVNVH